MGEIGFGVVGGVFWVNLIITTKKSIKRKVKIKS